MHIRNAQVYDVPFMIDLIKEFNREYYYVPVNEEKVRGVLERMVNSPEGVVLVSDHGVIGGVITEDPFRDWSALVEFGWYSKGRDGLRLLRQFERVGVYRECNEVRLTTLATSRNRVNELLSRRGYIETETSHRLIL